MKHFKKTHLVHSHKIYKCYVVITFLNNSWWRRHLPGEIWEKFILMLYTFQLTLVRLEFCVSPRYCGISYSSRLVESLFLSVSHGL